VANGARPLRRLINSSVERVRILRLNDLALVRAGILALLEKLPGMRFRFCTVQYPRINTARKTARISLQLNKAARRF
jgi:hypothetical protein